MLLCGITISHSQRFFPVTQKLGSLLLTAPPPRSIVSCRCGGFTWSCEAGDRHAELVEQMAWVLSLNSRPPPYLLQGLS